VLTRPSAGSPAYDESQKPLGPVVIASYTAVYATACGILSSGSYVTVYNAKRGGGQKLCSAFTSHPITSSSPEVVDGVIYVGTDDGYVLAFDETQCKSSGTLPLIWQSDQMMYGGAPDPVYGPPVVSFNRIHVVAESGTLYVWHRCDSGGCW
jgi:hypothetical protein